MHPETPMYDIREAERTHATVWRCLGNSENIRAALERLASFTVTKPFHSSFLFTTKLRDFSLPLVSTKVMTLSDSLFEMEYTYRVVMYRHNEYIVVLGRDEIVGETYEILSSVHKNLFSTELPVYAVTFDLRKLITNHKDRDTKLHAQLKNSEGIGSTTLYGDNVVRSVIYQTMLGGATVLTAKLRNPFGYEGIVIEFNEGGSFNSDTVLSRELIVDITRRLSDDYRS
jgi:hypothetical protein